MNLQRTALIALFILLGLVLVSCGGGISEDDTEAALRSLFEGDQEALNTRLCADDQLPENVEAVIPADVVFKEVTCERRNSDQMMCETVFDSSGTEDRVTIVFKIDDDMLCDAEVR